MKEGWEAKSIGDVCKVIAGQSPESKYYNTEGDGLPFYQGKKEFTDKYLGVPKKWTSKITKEAQKDDILMSVRAPVGPINFATQDICIGRGLAAIRASEMINEDFLFYFLLMHESEIECNNGAVFNSINKSQISMIEIPIPPLPEQKEIVAILDEAFAAIDTAQANIERNVENVNELFQSRLNEIFSRKGEGWEEKRLDEISKIVNGFSFKSKDFSDSNSVKSIKITNVGVKEFVENGENKLPKSYSDKYSNVKVRNGDLVLALTRTIISDGLKVARVPESYDGALLNQRVAAIIPENMVINSSFLYYYFCSDIVEEYVLSNVNTLMQPNLSIKDLNRMPVPVCDMDEQLQICQLIDSITGLSEKILESYNSKLSNLEELKQSLLQKAFAGELT